MSVVIRLTKTGKKHQISYRVVATDKRSKRDDKFLEILGFYHPHIKPVLKVNEPRVKFWESRGAKMTEAVEKLLKSNDQAKNEKSTP